LYFNNIDNIAGAGTITSMFVAPVFGQPYDDGTPKLIGIL
jgi:hypothetical protein